MRLLSPLDAHSHTQTDVIHACACIYAATQHFRGQTKLKQISRKEKTCNNIRIHRHGSLQNNEQEFKQEYNKFDIG